MCGVVVGDREEGQRRRRVGCVEFREGGVDEGFGCVRLALCAGGAGSERAAIVGGVAGRTTAAVFVPVRAAAVVAGTVAAGVPGLGGSV